MPPILQFIEKDITICLHGGSDIKKVENQMKRLEPLKDFGLNIYWNRRIDRKPTAYDSYSELVNEAISLSPTEFIVLINDRVVPKYDEVLFMLQLLQRGYAVASQWSVAFMALSKEVFRKIGWFDQRFYGGGCEDDDFCLRLRLANLAYYESLSCQYDQDWKSPLFKKDGMKCAKSAIHFRKKWKFFSNKLVKVMKEENYPKWENSLGQSRPDISNNWLDWTHSIIGIDYGKHSTDGYSRTYHFMTNDYKHEVRKVLEI